MNFITSLYRCRKILELQQQKVVTREDNVYPASYHNKEGFLSLLNKKLTFIELRGFLQPHYNKLLEIPFSKIESLDDVSQNTIVITELNGQKHCLTVYNIPSLNVTKTLSDLIYNDMI